MLRQAPALADIGFYWPRIRDLEEERQAVEDFVFYFIGFLTPGELSLDRGLLSQMSSTDSWPPILQRMQLCVSAYNQEGTRVCPRRAGRPTVKTIAVDKKDHSIVSLLKRGADALSGHIKIVLVG